MRPLWVQLMLALLTPLVGLAKDWFDNHQKKAKAKTNAEVAMKEAEAQVYRRRMTAETDWDLEALRQGKDSWKDEYLLVMFSIPFLMSFIEPLQPMVERGFQILEATPDWYKVGFSIMLAASFGVRQYARIRNPK